MKKSITILLAILFTFALGSIASAQEITAPAAAPTEAPKEYRAIEALKGKGFNACANKTSTVLKYLHKKDDFAYLNTWNIKTPDAHAASIYTIKNYSDGPSYALLSANATTDGRCDASFMQIFIFTDTCPKLRDTTFKDWKFYMDLSGVPVYEDPTSSSVVVALAPVNNGCLVMKSGMFYFPAESQ